MKPQRPQEPIENTRKINLSYRVTPERQEQLKIAAARRRVSIQQMLDDGVDLFLNGDAPAISHGHAVSIKSEDRWHLMLAEILGSGNVKAIDAVRGNLSVLIDYVRSLKNGSSKGKRETA